MFWKHSFQLVSLSKRKAIRKEFCLDDKPITIFAIYCCVNVILVAPQGFYCALFYCFLNAEVNFFFLFFCELSDELCYVKVQETLKRRFQTTQLWHRWKKYSGDQNSYLNETPKKENQSCLDLKPLDSKSIVSFFIQFFIYSFLLCSL